MDCDCVLFRIWKWVIDRSVCCYYCLFVVKILVVGYVCFGLNSSVEKYWEIIRKICFLRVLFWFFFVFCWFSMRWKYEEVWNWGLNFNYCFYWNSLNIVCKVNIYDVSIMFIIVMLKIKRFKKGLFWGCGFVVIIYCVVRIGWMFFVWFKRNKKGDDIWWNILRVVGC